MDNLTHSLFGLTLARTPLGRAGRGTTAALLLASNAPDIDIVVTAGGSANYLAYHRGPTHGPLGVVGLAAAVAGVVWLSRRKPRANETEPTASFLSMWAVSIVGIIGHILMDLPTSYGTRPLSPFSWTWFTTDWMPIVDVYLLVILGSMLWLGRGPHTDPTRAVRRRRYAAVALVLMAANYAVRAVSHHMAIARAASTFDNLLPAWCAEGVRPSGVLDWWPRPADADPRGLASTQCLVEFAAMPDFVSPFRWRMIARLSDSYEVRDLDLLRSDDTNAPGRRIQSTRVPNQWTPAVTTAARAPIAGVFLGFSRFPAARSVVAEDGTATVRWRDLRFLQTPREDGRQFRDGLFGATVVVGPDGRILEDRLGP